jgi:hypothetical protein
MAKSDIGSLNSSSGASSTVSKATTSAVKTSADSY